MRWQDWSPLKDWKEVSSFYQWCLIFVTSWTAAHQASLSITNSRSPPKPMSIELVMPSKHLLCRPLLLLPLSLWHICYSSTMIVVLSQSTPEKKLWPGLADFFHGIPFLIRRLNNNLVIQTLFWHRHFLENENMNLFISSTKCWGKIKISCKNKDFGNFLLP